MEEGVRAVKPGWIVIARHGEPSPDRTVTIDWRGFETWWDEIYDGAGLREGQAPPEKLLQEAAQADVILSSTLPRAMETADAIAGGRPVLRDAIFIEAPLPPPRWGVRMRPRQWAAFARMSWWLGNAHGRESRAEAERRAEAAAATLTARALRGENVVLCAHGWFNRMMRPVLHSWGWTCVYDGGDRYWSHRKYVRRAR